jgi:hypothetical protein
MVSKGFLDTLKTATPIQQFIDRTVISSEADLPGEVA